MAVRNGGMRSVLRHCRRERKEMERVAQRGKCTGLGKEARRREIGLWRMVAEDTPTPG